MKKFLLMGIALLGLTACDSYTATQVTFPDGFVVHARIADTPQKTEKGLMFVKHLPANEGMLFIFDKPDTHYFWMKNTLIDLDIIYLAPDQTITQIFDRVPHTYTYTPDAQVPIVPGYGQYVLETAAGTAEKHQLKPGDKLSFTLP